MRQHCFAFEISIHAPRGGSDQSAPYKDYRLLISIHAPRGGSDRHRDYRADPSCISIHAPRGGSDPPAWMVLDKYRHFNPRSPWGERPSTATPCQGGKDFNPRSPWGERRCPTRTPTAAILFQSTLPVGGATSRDRLAFDCQCHFNPRSPWGERRPARKGPDSVDYDFNPRSPWGERPFVNRSGKRPRSYFNPRSPWGERPKLLVLRIMQQKFQSTLPVGGATAQRSGAHGAERISIHAPRGGSDAYSSCQ